MFVPCAARIQISATVTVKDEKGSCYNNGNVTIFAFKIKGGNWGKKKWVFVFCFFALHLYLDEMPCGHLYCRHPATAQD